MKAAYNLDPRDIERSFPELLSLLNAAAARSYQTSTAIPLPQILNRDETMYLGALTPIEGGTTLRAVRLIPSEDYRVSPTGPPLRIGVGLRTRDRFELLGREWDSRSHALVVGTPFDLVTDEQKMVVGQGLVVRVMRRGWPTDWPKNATVETTFGYDPGA